MDLQDYEMVELFLRRLKMWMGLSRAKEVDFLFHTFSCCGYFLEAFSFNYFYTDFRGTKYEKMVMVVDSPLVAMSVVLFRKM